MEAAVRRILESAGRVRVSELAGECGISARQLSKTFRSVVGVSPKALARLVRFQRALRLAGRIPWAELAAACGYYDQAHLIREFRDIAGQTPALHLAQSHPLGAWFIDGSVFPILGHSRPVIFRATRVTATDSIFENPDHDFPQRILYRKQGKGGLFARIDGKEKGKEKGVDFPMTRVRCD